MSSALGLPVAGASIKLRVSFVEANAEVQVVRLWGSSGQRWEEYQRLGAEVQVAGAKVTGPRRDPVVGEFCLVKVNQLWHRCKVLERKAAEYRTFLLDTGCTALAGPHSLKGGQPELFHLPPQVQGYVLSTLVPSDHNWSEQALKLLSFLQAQEVQGLVKDLILPQGLVLLEVPAICKLLLDLGLAKSIPDSSFRAVLDRCLTPIGFSFQNMACPPFSNLVPQPVPPRPWTMDYFYPQLQVGVTEPVLVTHVIDPQRIFCQLRSLSHEVQRLSESMYHFYELQSGCGEPDLCQHPLVLGQPCATRGSDGHWYRSLLQEYFPDKRLAMVIHVDWGRRDVVPVTCLRSLAADYFRMPVVTFPCSLYGVSDVGTGWEPPMVMEIRSLLQGRQLSAKIEFYNSYEHIYVITLFAEDGVNLNCFYSVRAHTLSASKALSGTEKLALNQCTDEVRGDATETEIIPKKRVFVPNFPIIQLKTSMFYDALVEFVYDPFNFWVRTAENATKYCEMMEGITSLYSQASKLDGIIAKPQVGQLCCTKFKDDQYYRAAVVATHGKQVEVYFIDHGNTEIVEWYNVRELPAQFKAIPGLAVHCCLADIYPLGKTWSQEAILAFKLAVVDKKLVVHVVSKEPDKNIVEVLDLTRVEERNVGKVLAAAGHAKYEECAIAEPIVQFPHMLAAPNAETGQNLQTRLGLEGLDKNLNSNNCCNTNAFQHSPFEEQVYEPGTTINILVTYAQSPGLFWCQNASQMGKLKSFMNKIQDHCSHTECPYERDSSACLAKCSSDGRWYRAFISTGVLSHSENVEVFFIDYGKKETVSVKDLCSLKGELFNVKAYAFRCSLYNLVGPLGNNPFDWDKRASALFQQFVEKSSKKNLEFHCMFFATASLDKERFNIVDLFTPFTSICNLLVEKGFAKRLSHRSLTPQVELCSYYYSMHDIKIGSEEEIYITHITSSLEFYCQISRNAEIVEQIASASAKVCKEAKQMKSLESSLPICLAKFSDQQWYRGFVTQREPHTEIFFVDFGNTEKVAEGDMIPIPRKEYELLFSPMQAIKCSLSDIPCIVPDDIVAWFENTVLDKALKAIVVAKESDGKLIIELYNGTLQINSRLKSKLGLKDQKKNENILSDDKTISLQCNDKRKVSSNSGKDPATFQMQQQRSKESILQCVSQSDQSQQSASAYPTKAKEFPSEIKSDMSKKIPEKTSTFGERKDNCSQPPLIKLSNLPKRQIFPGLKLPVYMSHVNSIFDFYIQVAEDSILDNIYEVLNSEKSSSEILHENEVCVGDLVCAFFEEDALYYRAVITEKSFDGLHVQYVDYGNRSKIPANKIYSLARSLLSFPAMSVCCTLRGLNSLMNATCASDLCLTFVKRTGDLQLTCEFVKQCDLKWEIILCDQDGCINDLLTSQSDQTLPQQFENLCIKKDNIKDITDSATPSKYEWLLPQIGQCVKAYASAVDGPEYFWCQLSTSETDSLAVKIQEAGECSIEDTSFLLNIAIGSLCNVKYSEDDYWYRAIATKIEADLVTVRFVDYGNEETVSKERIRELTSDLAAVPFQSFPCRLSGFNVSEGCWISEGQTFFYNKITDDILELTILHIEEYGECKMPLATVNIWSKGRNINDEMTTYWKVETNQKSTLIQNPLLKKQSTTMFLSEDQEHIVLDDYEEDNLLGTACVISNESSSENAVAKAVEFKKNDLENFNFQEESNVDPIARPLTDPTVTGTFEKVADTSTGLSAGFSTLLRAT
ncbi:tudor domain-containing protein 6 [Discoglossus pictus]